MADQKKTEIKSVKEKPENKNGFKKGLKSVAKYFRECKGEIKKIVWPTPKETFKNLGIVIAVIAIIGLFVFGLDQGLYALLGLIMEVGTN